MYENAHIPKCTNTYCFSSVGFFTIVKLLNCKTYFGFPRINASFTKTESATFHINKMQKQNLVEKSCLMPIWEHCTAYTFCMWICSVKLCHKEIWGWGSQYQKVLLHRKDDRNPERFQVCYRVIRIRVILLYTLNSIFCFYRNTMCKTQIEIILYKRIKSN